MRVSLLMKTNKVANHDIIKHFQQPNMQAWCQLGDNAPSFAIVELSIKDDSEGLVENVNTTGVRKNPQFSDCIYLQA